MKIFLAQNQQGELSFRKGGLFQSDQCLITELICKAELQPGSGGDASFVRVQKILKDRQEGIEDCRQIPLDFTVFLTVKNLEEPTTRKLDGSVRGEILGELFKGCEAQRMDIKLHVELISSAKFRKTLVKQKLTYAAEEPEDEVSFRFSEQLSPCWSPTEDHKFIYEVTAELVIWCHPHESQFELNSALVQQNRKFLENAACSDFTLISGNGTSIHCHTCFLQVTSSKFNMMIQEDKRKLESEYSIRLGRDTTGDGVMALLKFIYFRDMEAPSRSPKIAFELLLVGHEYHIEILETAMKQLFLDKPVDWWWYENPDDDVATKVFTYTQKLIKLGEGEDYEDLKKKAVEVLHTKLCRPKVLKYS